MRNIRIIHILHVITNKSKNVAKRLYKTTFTRMEGILEELTWHMREQEDTVMLQVEKPNV